MESRFQATGIIASKNRESWNPATFFDCQVWRDCLIKKATYRLQKQTQLDSRRQSRIAPY